MFVSSISFVPPRVWPNQHVLCHSFCEQMAESYPCQFPIMSLCPHSFCLHREQKPPSSRNTLPLIQLPREFHTFARPFTVLILVQPNLKWMQKAVKKGSSS